MRQHAVGIIGYGGFGTYLHRAWAAHQNVTVAALSDMNPDAYAGQLPFYQDWKALLKHPGLTIVSIATLPNTHSMLAQAAMEAGINVVVEKPIATTISDAQALIECQARTGIKATVNYLLRYNPIIRSIKELSESGLFGNLRRIAVENYASDEPLSKSHWFWDQSISGGIFVEHAVHFIDLASMLTQARTTRITGHSVERTDGREDRVFASVLYENGVTATHYHDFSRPGMFEQTQIRFIYDLAEIETTGWIPLSGKVRLMGHPGQLDLLAQLPQLRILQNVPVADVRDDSRPAGWGALDPAQPSAPHTITSGGQHYAVETLIEAEFALASGKAEAYQTCLRALQEDFMASIDDPSHKTEITLQQGLDSLVIALAARESAHSRPG